MNYIYLYLYFADNHVERHHVKLFLDQSKTPLHCYYYEEQNNKPGKGIIIECKNIKCFYLSLQPLYALETEIEKQ